jgi:hypothetical protein
MHSQETLCTDGSISLDAVLPQYFVTEKIKFVDYLNELNGTQTQSFSDHGLVHTRKHLRTLNGSASSAKGRLDKLFSIAR